MKKLPNMDYFTGINLYEMMKARGHNVRLVIRNAEVDILLNDVLLDTFDKKDLDKRGWSYVKGKC